MDDSSLGLHLALWMAIIALLALVRSHRRTATTGLILAYVFNLWLIHWLAPSFYALPWYENFDIRLVAGGLEQSLYGIAAFAFGSLVLAPFLMGVGVLPTAAEQHEPDPYLPIGYVGTGVVFYLLLSTALGSLPSATAIIATGQQLIVVGVGLGCWQAWRTGNLRRLCAWIGAALCFPLITVVTRGFIGYGAGAAVCVLIFVSSFIRARARVVTAGVVLCYLGLTVFTSYMRDRNEIRASVWGGESLSSRIDTMSETASTFEWFDPTDVEQLKRLDGRLNQSLLVGQAVSYIAETGGFAHGATLWDALLSLIPRALWPDKTITAGSGNIVTEYTGVQYAAGTSVGIGHVMEFYINFGTWGVIIGFALMGTLLTILDVSAAQRLAAGDLHGFVLWYLPGISLLQVGGSMIEVTTSAVASLFVAMIANKYLARLQQKKAGRAAAAVSVADECIQEPASA